MPPAILAAVRIVRGLIFLAGKPFVGVWHSVRCRSHRAVCPVSFDSAPGFTPEAWCSGDLNCRFGASPVSASAATGLYQRFYFYLYLVFANTVEFALGSGAAGLRWRRTANYPRPPLNAVGNPATGVTPEAPQAFVASSTAPSACGLR